MTQWLLQIKATGHASGIMQSSVRAGLDVSVCVRAARVRASVYVDGFGTVPLGLSSMPLDGGCSVRTAHVLKRAKWGSLMHGTSRP